MFSSANSKAGKFKLQISEMESLIENKPFLYFVDHDDDKLNMLVREGRQKEFEYFFPDDDIPAPDPSDIATFMQSKLTTDPLSHSESKTLFKYYQTLIKLKKTHPVLKHCNKRNIRIDNAGKVFTIERWYNKNHIIAYLNFSDQTVKVILPSAFFGKASLVINSSENNGTALIRYPHLKSL